ncbi:hypothetical protein MMPV_004886 [Pyropia vietnamensis]
MGASASIPWQPRGSRWSLVTVDALNGDRGDAGDHGVWYQADVGRVLALHRHSARGEVVRRTGVHDVLAVERVTRGVWVDRTCTMVEAVNAIAGEGIRREGGRSAIKDLPVATLAAKTASGVTVPVRGQGGGRNVHPHNPIETALAARLSVGTVKSNGKRFPSYHAFWGDLLDFNTAGLLTALSQNYDRAVFGMPPPDDPATDVEVLLSVIVVVPELVALITTLITTRQRTRRDVAVLIFVFGSGLVSMADIVTLAVREASGAAWRAAAERNELMAGGSYLPFPLNPALRSVTLVLIAHTGYRPPLLWAMTAAMLASYVVVPVGVSITV